MGIRAVPAEQSFVGANLWADLGGDRAIYFSAIPIASDRSEVRVLDQREIAGLVVQRVAYESGIERFRFRCGMLRVEVEGDVPAPYRDMEVLLARLIVTLQCGG